MSLVAGTTFGVGLAISGMANPAKVLAFLDVAGRWDPTLALVMAGALVVAAPLFRLVLKRGRPWFTPHFVLSTLTHVDRRLIIGSAAFGIGWGLVGLCPGPAIVDLVTGERGIQVFVAAMLIGALAVSIFDRRGSPRTA